jgi:predicted nucleic acid-binding protein
LQRQTKLEHGERRSAAASAVLDEKLQAIRRPMLADEITSERADAALVAMLGLNLTRYQHTPFVGRIWELRTSVTAYDAAYVALAEVLPAVLFTCDGKLAQSHGHRAQIELLT